MKKLPKFLEQYFWADMLNIDKAKIPSLKNPSPRKVPKIITSKYLMNLHEKLIENYS